MELLAALELQLTIWELSTTGVAVVVAELTTGALLEQAVLAVVAVALAAVAAVAAALDTTLDKMEELG